jgi:hypothetical protein
VKVTIRQARPKPPPRRVHIVLDMDEAERLIAIACRVSYDSFYVQTLRSALVNAGVPTGKYKAGMRTDGLLHVEEKK